MELLKPGKKKDVPVISQRATHMEVNTELPLKK